MIIILKSFEFSSINGFSSCYLLLSLVWLIRCIVAYLWTYGLNTWEVNLVVFAIVVLGRLTCMASIEVVVCCACYSSIKHILWVLGYRYSSVFIVTSVDHPLRGIALI